MDLPEKKPAAPYRGHHGPQGPVKLGRILFLPDEHLSRQKSIYLNRLLNVFRPFAEVKMLTAAGVTEARVLAELEQSPFQLVLVPWHKYLEWRKLEAFFGLTRNSGPTTAGYHCGELATQTLGSTSDFARLILLDFGHTQPPECALLVRTLLVDRARSGLLPLLEPGALVPCDPWFEGQTAGQHMDTILDSPILREQDWLGEAQSLRILILSLWNLVFESGPSASELRKATQASRPRASLQIGASAQIVALRLCYTSDSSTPIDVLNKFWPDYERPSASTRSLLRHSDLLRVHPLAGTPEIEVVVALLRSRGSARAPDLLRTFWIEPLQANLVSEAQFPGSGGKDGHLVRISPKNPELADPQMATRRGQLETLEKCVQELERRLSRTSELLRERDILIDELKRGGVGNPQPLAPPDAESLLDAFTERFLLLHDELLEAIELSKSPSPLPGSRTLKSRINELFRREENWIKKIAGLIDLFQEGRDELKKTG